MLASLAARVLAKILDMPPAITQNVEVRRDLRIPMPDGVDVLADLYLPRNVSNAPTILVRTPYGRKEGAGIAQGMLPAQYGFQVLLQSCRGTAGSGGTFAPFVDERKDGLATVDWIERQPWFHGRLLGLGGSYTGIALWAAAAEAGDRFTAISQNITASQFRDSMYAGDAFSLHSALVWSAFMSRATGRFLPDMWSDITSLFRIKAALDHLPLAEADERAAGTPVPFYRNWLVSDGPGDPYWRFPDVAATTAPAVMVGGWYDIFLPWQLEDFVRLRAAGRKPYITIGPWTHGAIGGAGTAMREALTWFRARVNGEHGLLREKPVRLYVQGAEEWRDYDDWPVPHSPRTWHIGPSGLSPEAPEPSAPSRYRYDPAEPTPSLGGPLLTRDAGRYDNRSLEERADVLTFTSSPLERPLEVIGPVSARIHLRSSVGHTDVFVRLCDVDTNGKSTNVSDGLQRIAPGGFPAEADGSVRVDVSMWPTAYRFGPGHRIRVQVSSGAHPRFARNTGTGEPLATATRLVAADQEILHDPGHPSAIILPEVTIKRNFGR